MALEIVRAPDRDLLIPALDMMAESLGFTFDAAFTGEQFVQLEGIENFRLLVDRDAGARRSVVATLSTQRAGQYYGGVGLPMTGLRCVAVAPEARGRGILRTLLVDSLREQRDAGVLLGTLYASSPRIYRAFGYEHAGANMVRKVTMGSFGDPGAPRLAIEPVAPSEHEELRPLYHRVAERTPGWTERSAWWWRRALEKPGNPNRPRIYRFVRQPAAASEGAPSERRIEGYVVLSLVLGKIPSRVHVGEWVCETADAMQSALSLLYGMRSIFQTLTWTSGPVDYLTPFIEVPAGDVETAIGPIAAPINPWMLRLLSPKAAIEARGYPKELTTELHLDIEDHTLPENSGPLRVRIEGGRAEAKPGGLAQVRIDVRALASSFAAHFTPQTLMTAGLLAGSSEKLAGLATAFAGPPAWMWDAF